LNLAVLDRKKNKNNFFIKIKKKISNKKLNFKDFSSLNLQNIRITLRFMIITCLGF